MLHDLDEIEAATKAYEAAGNSKGRRLSWFEITSYYPVAFVTCLEWHARSRLVDFLTFRPSAVRVDDLKGQINDKVLPQAIAEGVTVPQLIGAMTTVGSSEKYIRIFDRIVSDLKISIHLRDILNPIILTKSANGEVLDELQRIFDYRNTIVHEIDFSTVGPWLVRSSIDFNEARGMGMVAKTVIEAVERTFSKLLPQGFPNKLDAELLPEDEFEYLSEQITRIESDITDEICNYRIQTGRGAYSDDWLGTLTTSRTNQKAELDFISAADFIPTRHFDFKRSLQIAYLRLRLDYLKRLRTEFA